MKKWRSASPARMTVCRIRNKTKNSDPSPLLPSRRDKAFFTVPDKILPPCTAKPFLDQSPVPGIPEMEQCPLDPLLAIPGHMEWFKVRRIETGMVHAG